MGSTARISTLACCVMMMLVALSVSSAPAHQTNSANGVSVTMHVTPDDEPLVGKSARILVTKVKPNRGRFSWSSCKCYLRITDSSGKVVLNRKASRRMRFTFPRATAYELLFSGRVKRGGSYKRFRVAFAVRAA